MKKALSLLLALALVVTSLWCTAGISLAASAIEDYFENPENWNTLYGDDIVGESTTNRVAIAQVTGDTYNNGAAAICFKGTMHNRTAAIALPVEAGKTYKLSFMYKGDFNGTATSYSIKKSGVYEKGATIVSQEGPSGTAVASLGSTGGITDNTSYNQYELTFTVGDNTDLYFAAHFWTASWVWIDDFKLVDMTPTYYEIPENWNTLYGDDIVGESTTNRVTIDQATTDTYNDGPAAIRFSGTMHNRDAAIALPVETGRTYKLSFMYKADIHSTIGAHSIKKSGVYEKGTTIVSGEGPSGIAVATHAATTSSTDKENYLPYELNFTVGENTDLYFVAFFWGATWVWIDDFKLEDITVEPVLSTSYNSKAAIRAAGNTDGSVVKNGLRIYNAIQNEWIENSNIVEFGSLVVRGEYLEAKFCKTTDATFADITTDGTERNITELLGSGVGLGVAYRAEGAETITSVIDGYEGTKNMLWDSDATKKVFTSYLTGISEAYYGSEYLVRTYAIDSNGNIYYGNTSSVSIFKVAQAISVANNEASTFDNAAFEAFVGNQTATYEQWCADNELEVGGLYTALYKN